MRLSIWKAQTFADRIRGLIGCPPIVEGRGLWLPTCRWVHTFLMLTELDVISIDCSGRVVLVLNRFSRRRIKIFPKSVYGIIEMRAGEASRLGIFAGIHVRFDELSSRSDLYT